MAKGNKGPGTRICPLCAETVRADATKCKFCGSTMVGLGKVGGDAPARRDRGAAPAGPTGPPWPAPAPDDVGLAGPAAVAGALVGFGVGAWLGTAPGVVLAFVGATAGFAAGWSRDPRAASSLLPAWPGDEQA